MGAAFSFALVLFRPRDWLELENPASVFKHMRWQEVGWQGNAPSAQLVRIYPVQRSSDCQGPNAAEDLPCVALCSRHHPEAAIPILAGQDVVHCRLDLEGGKPAQQGTAMQGRVHEFCVDLSPAVARK